MATHSSNLAWRIPLDRGSWWATVHRITQSLTQLKWLSMQKSRNLTYNINLKSKSRAVQFRKGDVWFFAHTPSLTMVPEQNISDCVEHSLKTTDYNNTTLIKESAYWVPCPWGTDLGKGPGNSHPGTQPPTPTTEYRLGDHSCSQSCCLYNLLWARTEFLGLVCSCPFALSSLVFLDGVSDGQTLEFWQSLCHLIISIWQLGGRSASIGQHSHPPLQFIAYFLDCYMQHVESPQNITVFDLFSGV